MPDDVKPAVFISYARDDTAAARRVADALRAGGIEVWFDQNELVGGDAWDQKLRRQIAECALFVPVISAATQARREGYFRLEWKLADERTHLMAEGTPFLLPVKIDETNERGALVPKSFLAVQWTSAPGGEVPAAFVERVGKLVGGSVMEAGRPRPAQRDEGVAPPEVQQVGRALRARRRASSVVVAVATLATIAGWWIWRQESPATTLAEPAARRSAPPTSEKAALPAAAKSIAVLPFENLSPDKADEIFADGMHDEVISALTKIRDLTVIARSSVLGYRKIEGRNLRQIAAELKVAHVLEGRVRRMGSQVKVTVELIEVGTGKLLWANPYTEELTNAFTIQSKLADAITTALKATFSPEEKSRIDRQFTKDPVAYELFLRAKIADEKISGRAGLAGFDQVAALYQSAVAQDPAFALAYARLTRIHGMAYWFGDVDPSPARRGLAEAAMAAAQRLAPDAPETRMARGTVAYFCDNDWPRALAEYKQAEVELPNDAFLQALIAFTHRRLGHWQETVNYLERTLVLSPLDLYHTHQTGLFLMTLRRYGPSRELAERCVGFSRDSSALELLERTRFAIDGDLGAYARALGARPLAGTDPTGMRQAYQIAMLTRDYAGAERALADPRLKDLGTSEGIAVEPVTLHRALVAFLDGRSEPARRFAEEAMAEYRRGTWTRRQQPYVAMAVALAKALAGRADEAVRETEASAESAIKADAYGGTLGLFALGRIYVIFDRRDEALATLRRCFDGPSFLSANEIRLDPLWSRLKDDPRFEEILKSAKAL